MHHTQRQEEQETHHLHHPHPHQTHVIGMLMDADDTMEGMKLDFDSCLAPVAGARDAEVKQSSIQWSSSESSSQGSVVDQEPEGMIEWLTRIGGHTQGTQEEQQPSHLSSVPDIPIATLARELVKATDTILTGYQMTTRPTCPGCTLGNGCFECQIRRDGYDAAVAAKQMACDMLTMIGGTFVVTTSPARSTPPTIVDSITPSPHSKLPHANNHAWNIANITHTM